LAITLTTSLDGKWRKSGEKEREGERVAVFYLLLVYLRHTPR